MPDNINDTLLLSQTSFLKWRQTPISERCSALNAWADKVDAQKDTLAAIITSEIKKPITQSIAEIDKCIKAIKWFTQAAAKHTWQETLTEGSIKHTPLGPILGIMPFNFPCWQSIRFMVPTLLSGCTIIIRPPQYGQKSIQYLIDLATTLPHGVAQIIECPHEQINKIIHHQIIRGASFTGSSHVGSLIGQYCGSAIKPVILELGGDDAYIICDDADLETAAQKIAISRLRNNGQACSAAKRILLTPSTEHDFINHLIDTLQNIKYGSIMDESTEIGPLVSQQAYDRLTQQVDKSIQEGAQVIYQGRRSNTENFYPPTILHYTIDEHNTPHDELFGPVFSLYTCKNQTEMISVANQTNFGLCSGVFTQNRETAQSIMDQLQSGQVCHNMCFSSEPHLPFTGIKDSGIGSECSANALNNFTFPKLYRF